MSGVGDDRWRGGRGYGQRHQGGTYRDRHGGGHQQDRHVHRGQGNNNLTTPAIWTVPPSGPAREAHVPVMGFNAAEAKDILRKGCQKGGSQDPQPFIYKPANEEGNSMRPSGPWASKPNSMTNGKDFFLELRKQLSGLQQGNVQGG